MTLPRAARGVVASFAAIACLIGTAAHPSLDAAGSTAPFIRIENSKPGTLDWQLTNPAYASGVIEGYASLTSVNRGGQIRLFVNTAEPSYTMDIFRMGYYGGLGARRMMNTIPRRGRTQLTPAPAPVTGLVECDWVDPFVLDIPNTVDATDWMSGIYLVKLTAGVSRKQQYIVFTVRDDSRSTDLIMAQTVNTYQAYNPWGGKSLYGTIASRGDTANKATHVSFNRPYFGDESNGASGFFAREFPMLRWLEAEGYDISYATNVDVDRDPNLLLSHKAFLSVGHDEYWSWNMRDHVEAARDRGISLGFFSGNTSYWQVRLESSVLGGEPARTLVGYKETWTQDPITPASFKTNLWRSAPVNRSEDTMIGVRFVTQARPAFVVEDASHWVFTGTGLHNGDRLTKPDGTPFLGYEVDSMGPGSPANAQRLAHSPVTPGAANFADMTVYRAASGATVFATGSIDWSQTIPQIIQITRNVLARFISGTFAESTPLRPLLPVPFSAQNIGDVGRPGFVATVGTQSLTLNGGGREMARTDDALYYVYQGLTGDGHIIARLNALQHYWNNRAGLMIRESLAPNSKYVALVGRPTESRSVLEEGVEFRVRALNGDLPRLVGSQDLRLPNWLKLIRAGNSFSSFVSADGITWIQVAATTVTMNSAVYIGMSVSSAQYSVWATASFDNISVNGSASPPPPPPPPGPLCTSVALDRTSIYVGGPEANWTIAVSAPPTCTWTAVSDSPWLVVRSTSPTPAIGSGSLRVQAITNTTGLKRMGRIIIGGIVYTVTQAPTVPTPPPPPPPPVGACPSVTLDRSSYYAGAPEANWTIIVVAPTSTCAWTAVSDSSWLIVKSTTPAPAAGNGSVAVRAVTNPTGSSRVGRFTIAGVVYVVTQGR